MTDNRASAFNLSSSLDAYRGADDINAMVCGGPALLRDVHEPRAKISRSLTLKVVVTMLKVLCMITRLSS